MNFDGSGEEWTSGLTIFGIYMTTTKTVTDLYGKDVVTLPNI